MKIIFEIDKYMERLDFPMQARSAFLQLEQRLGEDAVGIQVFYQQIEQFMTKKTAFSEIEEQLKPIAKRFSISIYTVDMLFLLACLPNLFEKYMKANLPETLFWDTMMDSKYKLLECKTIHDVWGIFSGWWYLEFYHLERFALGRFQYERAAFDYDYYEKDEFVLNRGDTVINFHIPSSGAMTKELRLDSYKKAYRFFAKEIKNGILPMVCDSWLLFQEHHNMLPESSNIRSFINDFTILNQSESEQFGNAWRIYGKNDMESLQELPENSSLQRGYKQLLLAGGKAGSGYGVILFDGEKIL